jgi:Protein of unknown function (DUF2752)
LYPQRALAIVPPPLTTLEIDREYPDVRPAPAVWVRGSLVMLGLGLTAVFGIAFWLNPYQADGSARRMETHRQLGLPACTFYAVTGVPCPACGMTTSFALLVRGDVGNSVRANAVGTLLAVFGLILIPWCAVGALMGRLPLIRSPERALTIAVSVFLSLMLLRWLIVVGFWRSAA